MYEMPEALCKECSAAAGETLQMAACGDVAVVLKAAGSREQSVYIPQTSQPFLKFPLFSAPFF